MISYRGVKRIRKVAKTGRMSVGDAQFFARRTVEAAKHARLRKVRKEVAELRAVEQELRRRKGL